MHEDVVDARRYSYTFQCNECMMYCEYQYCNDKEGAINVWNNRKPLERVIERLEEKESSYRERAKEELNEFCLEMFHLLYDEADGLKKAIEIVKEGMG